MKTRSKTAMKRKFSVLIWGHGHAYNSYLNLIQGCDSITIIGIYSPVKLGLISLDGYAVINDSEIQKYAIDYIIDCSDETTSHKLELFCNSHNFARKCVISARVFSLPAFNFNDYVKLRNNPPTIISMNCFSYYLYDRLDLPFTSPTIDCFVGWHDFIEFCCHLKEYLSKTVDINSVIHDGTNWVMSLGSIKINFSHDDDNFAVVDKWLRRSSRVNYDNIFVCAYFDHLGDVKEFANIPYPKVCFTSEKIDLPDFYYLPLIEDKMLRNMVISIAKGGLPLINPIQMLLKKQDFIRTEFSQQ